MNVVIVYDSRSGNTADAARQISDLFRQKGHEVESHPVAEAGAVTASADLLCVGSWTQGLLVVGQHPTAAILRWIDGLPPLAGKPAVVFCSYAIAAGGTLAKMASALSAKGAAVRWQLPFRGRRARDLSGFSSWIQEGAKSPAPRP